MLLECVDDAELNSFSFGKSGVSGLLVFTSVITKIEGVMKLLQERYLTK